MPSRHACATITCTHSCPTPQNTTVTGAIRRRRRLHCRPPMPPLCRRFRRRFHALRSQLTVLLTRSTERPAPSLRPRALLTQAPPSRTYGCSVQRDRAAGRWNRCLTRSRRSAFCPSNRPASRTRCNHMMSSSHRSSIMLFSTKSSTALGASHAARTSSSPMNWAPLSRSSKGVEPMHVATPAADSLEMRQ
jgi:hypothetical protein